MRNQLFQELCFISRSTNLACILYCEGEITNRDKLGHRLPPDAGPQNDGIVAEAWFLVPITLKLISSRLFDCQFVQCAFAGSTEPENAR